MTKKQRDAANRWLAEYEQRISFDRAKRDVRKLWPFSCVALPDIPTETREKSKTIRDARNTARRYKRHLAREARVAKILERVR